MNISELKDALRLGGISPSAYSFFGEGLGENYVLGKEGQDWIVYYSERGERQGVRRFESESAACEYFFLKLTAEKTVR
jgi:hypothetical protein